VRFTSSNHNSRRETNSLSRHRLFEHSPSLFVSCCAQGAPGDFYHVLSEGACDITVDGRCVLQARPGMGFGELALLYDAPRAASVTVTSPAGARTWALDRATFKQVMISTTMRKREAWGAFLKQVPLFGTLTQGERLIIADALQPVRAVPARARECLRGVASSRCPSSCLSPSRHPPFPPASTAPPCPPARSSR